MFIQVQFICLSQDILNRCAFQCRTARNFKELSTISFIGFTISFGNI